VITRTRKSLGILAATATLAATAVALTGGTASADPPAGEPLRPIVGVGSDTTDPVMNGLAEAIVVNGTKPLASTTRSGHVRSRDSAAAAKYLDNARRHDGSAARERLLGGRRRSSTPHSGNARFGCTRLRPLLVAEPERRPGAATYSPFAQDGLTYAGPARQHHPEGPHPAAAHRDLQLRALRHRPARRAAVRPAHPAGRIRHPPVVAGLRRPERGSGVQLALRPGHLPDPGTGTRASVQEHDGRGLVTKTSIVPFAASQWAAQSVGAINDRRFEAVLGGIGGVPAIAVNPGAPGVRQVYNVVPTDRIGGSGEGDALLNQIFIGSTSEICKQSAHRPLRLAAVPDCGATNLVTP
jgi:hypothetical protein